MTWRLRVQIEVEHPLIEALEAYEEPLLFLEPRSRYDQCIVGLGERFHDIFIVYDRHCVLTVIAEDIEADRSEDDDEDVMTEALEHFAFNIVGGWVGETTPAFVTLDPAEM